jgi:DNA gyrase subunit A
MPQLSLFGSKHKPVEEVAFHELFAQNYGQYGLFVVQDRALPDARDGLKPVQRRILYTLLEGGYLSSKPYKKSAEIVGKVLGDRHPHGDGSVYDAMTRMAQPFSMRYTMIDGQGNWGASDGSPAAAYRYTEAKLTALAEALLGEDIGKATVPLIMTYKQEARVLEPVYLSGHIPPVINPIDGIAVGISTSVPPHNLREVLNTTTIMLEAGVLDDKTFSTEQLMKSLPGPDYPEGGRIMAVAGGLKEYLENGRGKFVVRGEIVVEQPSPNKKLLVITALPPIGRDKVVSSIIDAINERKLEGVVPEPPLDETNEERTRIVLELKRDANPATVIEALWQSTLLQINVSVQMYFLFADKMFSEAKRPKQVGMVELLTYWLYHKLDVLERRLNFELKEFKTRLHTVEALMIGAKNARPIVQIFQEAENRPAAKETLRLKYKLSEEQAETIAAMSLSQVTKLDAGKYEAEKAELLNKISQHEMLLASRKERINLLKSELKETAKKFGDDRRTLIDQSELKATGNPETRIAEFIAPREPLALALHEGNLIKKTPLNVFGQGAKGAKGDETLTHLIAVQPDQFALVATNQGRVFSLPLDNLAINTRAGKGEHIAKHLKLETGEKVISLLAVSAQAFEDSNLYLVEFSQLGKVKKSPIGDYKSAGNSGIGSLKLGTGDEVITVLLSDGKSDYFVTTKLGQTLRFSDDKLSVQGRIGQGQASIALGTNDKTVSAGVANPDKTNLHLIILTSAGQIKKTPLAEYPNKGRATGGVATMILNSGETIVATKPVQEGELLLIATPAGSTVTSVADLAASARAKKGQAISWSGSGSSNRLVALELK